MNARSLMKMFDELQIVLSSLKFEYYNIAMIETWFYSSSNIEMYYVNGYSRF